MANNKVISTFDNLYDRVRCDREDFMDEDAFRSKLSDIIDIGFIETSSLDDIILYSAKHNLKWGEFVHIDDPVKKSILLLLVENPTTFFVLQNTQKGKMRIASLEIKNWGQDKTNKVVSFIIVDNDKTLADQSANGLSKVIGYDNNEILLLSSNSKYTYESIKTTIDAYEYNDDYKMPVIALLCNDKQCEKMLKLINHIHKKVSSVKGSTLRYGIIWDEADKTYKQLRDKRYTINGESKTFRDYIVDDNVGLYRLGFVTATDGNLLDEEYPECANAYLYPVDISPEDQMHYRALHHPESITHKVPYAKHNNNSYAKEVIEKNLDHFMTPITLPSGEMYFRKIIIHSNAKTVDMVLVAKLCNEKNMHALVFNGYGGASIKVYKKGHAVDTYKTSGKQFNELLFSIYKDLGLNDKPLIIIGRRKVDRGLGFHYCPRGTNEEGLIWTDMILGRIEDKNTAVQKAGRLAGIIGHSPQYPGNTHYWTDEYTENIIRRHNTIVDKSNISVGSSVLQAVKHAEQSTPIVKVNHRVDMNTFLVYNDEDIVKKVCDELEYHYTAIKPRTSGPNIGFRETSLNSKSAKVSLLDAINKVQTAYGTAKNKNTKKDEPRKITYRIYYPCYSNLDDSTSLHFVIIIRPGTDVTKLENIKINYPSLHIPQTGDYLI